MSNLDSYYLYITQTPKIMRFLNIYLTLGSWFKANFAAIEIYEYRKQFIQDFISR